MTPLRVVVLVPWLLSACAGRELPEPLRPIGANQLRSVDDFAGIPERKTRSQALFLEMNRVLSHPRCNNCHPVGDTPLQGLEQVAHDPPVVRGPDDHGVVGMECTGCHQDRNQDLARVPGAPNWAVAPLEMGWVGRTPAEIGTQLKDPARNGGRTLADIVEHNGHDPLVAWAWDPGADREPAPGTQAELGALTAAWVDTGAQCPEEPP